MKLQNKKFLVTGGAGFIGSHTVDELIQLGGEVVIVDNLSTGKKENINPRAKFYELNIADDEFKRILQTELPQTIYHFAFHVLVPKSVENPLLDMEALIGSVKMLKKAKELGIGKIIFASSGFIYGNSACLPCTEEHEMAPVSPYVISKNAVENYLMFFKNAYNLPFVTLRYGTIYGPRQITGAMADYIRNLIHGKQAEIWGDGTKTRDYVFIEDVVKANLLALQVPDDHPFPVFNIGAGIETSINKLYKKIALFLGEKADPIYHPDRAGELMRLCLDNTKAKKELDWEPQYSLDAGLKLTIEYAQKI